MTGCAGWPFSGRVASCALPSSSRSSSSSESSAAAGAAPFALGAGSQPSVAVDGAGTAHIAWNGPEVDAHAPRYCRLPRGATACDVALTLPTAAGTDTTTRPYVSLSGGRVSVLVHRFGTVNELTHYVSTDGGLSFTSRTAGGSVPIYEAADGPGDSVSIVTNADGRGGLFLNAPLAGAAPAGFAALDTTRPYYGSVGMDGATPVVTFSTTAGDAVWRRYSGTGDLNAASSWTPPVGVGAVDYPRLASGAPGLFLLAGDAAGTMSVRRWTGAGFGAPAAIGPGDASESHLFVDAGGRLHAIYPRLDAQGYHLQHSVSDDGVSWQSGSVLVQTDDEEGGLRVAAAADHVGVAVWSSRVAGAPEIRVEAVGPGAPAAPPPPPPPPPPEPQPVAGRTVVVVPSGTVRVRLAGRSTFTALTALDDVPMGATLDTKRGAVVLRARNARTGAIETVRLSDGWFKVSQSGRVVNFTLNEPLARCPRRAARRRRSRGRASSGPTGRVRSAPPASTARRRSAGRAGSCRTRARARPRGSRRAR